MWAESDVTGFIKKNVNIFDLEMWKCVTWCKIHNPEYRVSSTNSLREIHVQMALGEQQWEWNADSVQKWTKLLCVLSKVEKTPGRLCSYSWSTVCCDPVGGRVAAETTLTRRGKKTWRNRDAWRKNCRAHPVAQLLPLHNSSIGWLWVQFVWKRRGFRRRLHRLDEKQPSHGRSNSGGPMVYNTSWQGVKNT